MKRPPPQPRSRRPLSEPAAAPRLRGAWALVITTVVLTPLFYSTAQDSFRLPKDLLFRALGIALTAVVMIDAVRFGWPRTQFLAAVRNLAVAVPLFAVVWTALTTLTSVNRWLSGTALGFVALFALFYLVVYALAGDASLKVLAAVIAPSIVTAIVAILQELEVWNPFEFPESLGRHARTIGLLGNPDYVGVYLSVSVLMCLVLMLIGATNRMLMGGITLLLGAGVLVSQSFTAIVALFAGILVVLAIERRVAVGATILALAVICGISYAPIRQRLETNFEYARHREFDRFFSGRLGPYVTALRMFADHPVTGVGPGCFPFEFLEYRNKLQRDLGVKLRLDVGGQNFGEVHNDHLQVLAETGLPGWLLLAAGVAAIGRCSFRREPTEMRRRFARLFALPLAVTLAILMLGQFPLHLTAVLATDLFLAALITRWSDLGS